MGNLEEVPTIIALIPEIIAPHTVQDMRPKLPEEISGVRKSSRVTFQKKQGYITSITGSKYTINVSQLEYHGALHMDLYMLFMKITEE